MSMIICISIALALIYGFAQLMYLDLEREDYPHISFKEFLALQQTAPDKWEICGDEFFSKYVKYKPNAINLDDANKIIEMNTIIGEIRLAIYDQRHRKETKELHKYWVADIEEYQTKEKHND